MDKPISVGDLVVLIKSKCGNEGAFGTVIAPFGITPVMYQGTPWHGLSDERGLHCWMVRWENKRFSRLGTFLIESPCPGPWLKRIKPLSEFEGEKREETVNA